MNELLIQRASKTDVAEIHTLQKKFIIKPELARLHPEGFIFSHVTERFLEECIDDTGIYIAKNTFHTVIGFMITCSPELAKHTWFYKDSVGPLSQMVRDRYGTETNSTIGFQVGIEKEYRSHGIPAQLNRELAKHVYPQYNVLVGEVAYENIASTKAFIRKGLMEQIGKISGAGLEWAVIACELKNLL